MASTEVKAQPIITGEALAQAAADFCVHTHQDSKVFKRSEKMYGKETYTLKIPFTSHHFVFWGMIGDGTPTDIAGYGVFDGDGHIGDMWNVNRIYTIHEFVHDVLAKHFPTRMSNLQAHDMEFRMSNHIRELTAIVRTLQQDR
jgi:hypothetical protein